MNEKLLEAVQLAVRIVVPLLAFTIGLGAGKAHPLWLWERKNLLVRSLAAVLLVVPALAVIVVEVVPVGQTVGAGLLVVALSAGPVMAVLKSRKRGADENYAFNLDVWLLALNLVWLPLAVSVVGALFGRELRFGVGEVAKVILPLQLVPLVAGALLGRFWPKAERFARPLFLGVVAAFAAIVLLVLIAVLRPMLALGAAHLSVIAAFALLAVAVGHLMGGPDEGTRRVLATFTSMRFPAMALALASLTQAGQRVLPVVLAYLLFTAIVLALYAAVSRRAAAPPPITAARTR